MERIDHGVNVLDDPGLVALAKAKRIGFTVVPIVLYGPLPGAINIQYFDRCATAAKAMLDAGLLVTLASDDPGIMCRLYVGQIYVSTWERLNLPASDTVTFARNGFEMARISSADRQRYLAMVDDVVKRFPSASSAVVSAK